MNILKEFVHNHFCIIFRFSSWTPLYLLLRNDVSLDGKMLRLVGRTKCGCRNIPMGVWAQIFNSWMAVVKRGLRFTIMLNLLWTNDVGIIYWFLWSVTLKSIFKSNLKHCNCNTRNHICISKFNKSWKRKKTLSENNDNEDFYLVSVIALSVVEWSIQDVENHRRGLSDDIVNRVTATRCLPPISPPTHKSYVIFV